MKVKRNLLVAALHIAVLAGFSLLQGCATGECPVCWLNWPYNEPPQEPILVPAEPAEPMDMDDAIFLPPAAPEQMPEITFSEPVMPEPVVPAVDDHIYTVKKGDTLSGIASMYGTSWKRLAEYNGLSNPNKLFVNQEIRIPGTLSASAPVSRLSAPVSSPSAGSSASSARGAIKQGSSYVIQKGDTLSGIAKRAGLSVDEIKAANALDSSMIVAGKSLSIPRKGEVNVPTSYTTPVVNTVPDAEPIPMATEVETAPEPAPLAGIAPVESTASAPIYEHVLYPGETLEDVARQYGTTQDEIMQLNNLSSVDSVKPGTKLLVPIPE